MFEADVAELAGRSLGAHDIALCDRTLEIGTEGCDSRAHEQMFARLGVVLQLEA